MYEQTLELERDHKTGTKNLQMVKEHARGKDPKEGYQATSSSRQGLVDCGGTAHAHTANTQVIIPFEAAPRFASLPGATSY
jgi:hypothetical protein